MEVGRPDVIAINHDDYHAEHVGRTADGRQFILTTPFEPASGLHLGSEFVALYTFDAAGKLLEARIEDFGPRATLDDRKRRELCERWLQELGEVTFERIEVAPFAVQKFGTTFGLVLHAGPEEPDDPLDRDNAAMRNYMAFYEPWDSGDYDT